MASRKKNRTIRTELNDARKRARLERQARDRADARTEELTQELREAKTTIAALAERNAILAEEIQIMRTREQLRKA